VGTGAEDSAGLKLARREYNQWCLSLDDLQLWMVVKPSLEPIMEALQAKLAGRG
jgi:hypothetical protein